MSCCGNERRARSLGLQPSPAPAPSPPIKPVFFEYTGHTALTVLGPMTGQRYRFAAPGAILEIDPRDAGGLMSVPHLRRARPSS